MRSSPLLDMKAVWVSTHPRMASFRKRFYLPGMALLGLAVFSIAGGHWAILQTLAWAQMMREYSKNGSVVEAAQKTFGGEAPCSLCKKIAAARQQEEKIPTTVKTEKSSDVFLMTATDLLPVQVGRSFSYQCTCPASFTVRSDPPPIPVPIRPA